MLFRHSGARGDIIYSLAFIPHFSYDKNTLIITPNPSYVSFPNTHMAGSTISDDEIYQFAEFLKTQNIDVIGPKEAEAQKIVRVDYDLDRFRQFFGIARGDLLLANGMALGIAVGDYTVSRDGWFNKATMSPKLTKDIIINRTMRYRSYLNYGELEYYKDSCGFIGTDEEYKDFCDKYFNVERIYTNSVKDFADTILGSKLFVCNQSFGFAIAESFAHPRVVEVWSENVGMYTKNCYSALTNNLIEGLFND